MSDPLNLVDLIREAIGQTGASKTEIARNAGVNHAQIVKLMNGNTKELKTPTINKLLPALGFEVVRERVGLAGRLSVAAGAEKFLKELAPTEPVDFWATAPIGVYCSRLEDGRYQFVNDQFANMLGFQNGRKFLDDINDSTQLYKGSRQINVTEEVPKTRIWDVYVASQRKRYALAESFRCVTHEGKTYVIGLALDVTSSHLEKEKLQNYKKQFQLLLDDEHLNIGVHTIGKNSADEGSVDGINRRGRELLALGDWEPKDIEQLWGDDQARDRANKKLDGRLPVTKGAFRTFFDTEGKPLPVVITDYPVNDPAHRFDALTTGQDKRSAMITSFRNVEVKSEVMEILERFGPKNPLLSGAGIRSFIKVPDHDHKVEGQDASPFQFKDANLKLKQELVLRGKLSEVETNEDGIESVDGKTGEELFGELENQYQEVDAKVFERNSPMQMIESHPFPSHLPDTPSVREVHTIKMPHRNSEGKVIGVEGYFWEVREEQAVFEALLAAYQPWDYLDLLPVCVYRKDVNLRFTYANQSYLDRMQVASVRDVVAKSDQELFAKDRADQYERDDEALKADPTKPITRIERNGDDWVKVIKTAITKSSDAPMDERIETFDGILGVFWKVDYEEMERFVTNNRPK